MKTEMKITKVASGGGTLYKIEDVSDNFIVLNPEEALLVLQFLYEELADITRLVNALPSGPLLATYLCGRTVTISGPAAQAIAAEVRGQHCPECDEFYEKYGFYRARHPVNEPQAIGEDRTTGEQERLS